MPPFFGIDTLFKLGDIENSLSRLDFTGTLKKYTGGRGGEISPSCSFPPTAGAISISESRLSVHNVPYIRINAVSCVCLNLF